MAKTEEGHDPYGKMNKHAESIRHSDHRFTNASYTFTWVILIIDEGAGWQPIITVIDPAAHLHPCLLVLLLSIKKSCSFSIPNMSIYHFRNHIEDTKAPI